MVHPHAAVHVAHLRPHWREPVRECTQGGSHQVPAGRPTDPLPRACRHPSAPSPPAAPPPPAPRSRPHLDLGAAGARLLPGALQADLGDVPLQRQVGVVGRPPVDLDLVVGLHQGHGCSGGWLGKGWIGGAGAPRAACPGPCCPGGTRRLPQAPSQRQHSAHPGASAAARSWPPRWSCRRWSRQWRPAGMRKGSKHAAASVGSVQPPSSARTRPACHRRPHAAPPRRHSRAVAEPQQQAARARLQARGLLELQALLLCRHRAHDVWLERHDHSVSGILDLRWSTQQCSIAPFSA